MEVLNNPVVAVLGILSSIVGIASVFLPASSGRAKVVHFFYGIVIVALAVPLTSYANRLSRIQRAERAANELVARREMDFTPDGFVQATLAFLEANRNSFPDAYARAQKMCEGYKCYQGGSADLDKSYDMINLEHAMEGLLRGIAAVDSSK